MRLITVLLLNCLLVFSVSAETLTIKYRPDPVNISTNNFEEFNLKDSSFVNRIIYDRQNQYLIVRLNETYYHYCSIPKFKVDSWIKSASLGKYYNSQVKGKYDCRLYPVPRY